MTSASPTDQRVPSRLPPPRFLPPIISDNLKAALRTGAWCGVGASCSSYPFAIYINIQQPIFSALALGTEWFYIGAAFQMTRGTLVTLYGGDEKLTDRDRVWASSVGGAVGGVARALGRYRRSPHLIVANPLVGFVGTGLAQIALNKYYRDWKYAPKTPESETPWMKWVMEQRWSPVRLIDDDDYTAMLEENILQVDVDMEMLQERIDNLKERIKARDARRVARKLKEAKKVGHEAFKEDRENEPK